MKAFDELRSKAKQTRDDVIRVARQQYEQTIQDIAVLERRLAPPHPVERPKTVRTKPLVDLIVDCLPRDRAFDIDALYGWVREADPDRQPSKATIRTNVHRLLRQGVLKRVQRADGTRKAEFAVSALEVEREPTLREWVERITGESDEPLPADEVLVRMLDAGYQPDCDPKDVLKSVQEVIRKST